MLVTSCQKNDKYINKYVTKLVMTNTINVTFTDEELSLVRIAKGDLSYRLWIVALARQQLLQKAEEK